MDPFVVASLGRKTFRTKVIRHNLNPVFDEKMIFQVMRNEEAFSMSFSVVDRDKLSGNDFVGSANFPLQTVVVTAPQIDLTTGLYKLHEPPEIAQQSQSIPTKEPTKSRFRLPLSRSSSAQSLTKLARPGLKSKDSSTSLSSQTQIETLQVPPTSDFSPNVLTHVQSAPEPFHEQLINKPDDPDMKEYQIPLTLKNKDRWEDKHNPVLYIRAKYMPYKALRQQFWRAMLRQYDADDSHRVSKVELTTMLDTLGSTLRETTIDGFFRRFAIENGSSRGGSLDLTFDQAVICLEDQLQLTSQQRSFRNALKGYLPIPHDHHNGDGVNESGSASPFAESVSPAGPPNPDIDLAGVDDAVIRKTSQISQAEKGDLLDPDDLADDQGEEHVIEIRECPLCHQPGLNKRSDADIITHLACDASDDWRQVNSIVMGGFVTASQAQRKWYSKVITKIGYGGYKLGANSANILVQDRITGQINEERMSVYVRLGIRLLYKGLKSKDMEKKRSTDDYFYVFF
jgi:phosphatidylserine decarboxylase